MTIHRPAALSHRAMPKPRRSRLGVAWLLVFLSLAGLSGAGIINRFLPNGAPKIAETRQVTAPDVDGPHKIVPIGERKPGQRSVGINPDRTQVDESIPDVDPPTWRELHLRMVKASGKLLWIDMLRPLKWLEERGARVGGTVWLELPEFGAVGEAKVLYVGPCPEIKPGRGNVITATFKHESDGNLFDLCLADQGELTGVTGNHLYWSLDRREFVEVAHLRRGERLNTAYGETSVVSLTPITDEFVYNMEVHREHVYRVGSLGTLVHNSYIINDVLNEAANATGNITSRFVLTHAEALDAGLKWLGKGYREIGKPGSGVFVSADGLRRFRIDGNSLLGKHKPNVPHVHFEWLENALDSLPTGNSHVPIQ